MTDTPELMFEDSEVKPSGRKARVVSDALWQALADSAKRDVAKMVTGSKGAVDGLIKDLGSAAVKRLYDMTIETAMLEGDKRKLTFSAVAKPADKAPVK
jgi:hypothetical protein